MNIYTVTVAYYDAWNEQTLIVEADSIAEACVKAIDIADGERVDRYQLHSWDPGASFVGGIAEGGDPADNDGPYVLDNVIGGPVPFEHSEEAVFCTGILLEAVKAALPEIERELEQREQSGKAEALASLRAIVAQIRTVIAGAER